MSTNAMCVGCLEESPQGNLQKRTKIGVFLIIINSLFNRYKLTASTYIQPGIVLRIEDKGINEVILSLIWFVF